MNEKKINLMKADEIIVSNLGSAADEFYGTEYTKLKRAAGKVDANPDLSPVDRNTVNRRARLLYKKLYPAQTSETADHAMTVEAAVTHLKIMITQLSAKPEVKMLINFIRDRLESTSVTDSFSASEGTILEKIHNALSLPNMPLPVFNKAVMKIIQNNK